MAEIKDWSIYPNFTKAEFDCKETGTNKMDSEFMAKLQAIRSEYGMALRITSGYRSPLHSIEKKKDSPGAHSSGRAADISINGKAAYKLLELAIKHGMTGIGIQQKGASRFIHLDDIENGGKFPRPTIFSY
jgi:uncharacterized protein YcbK (DUF882 family)